MGQLTIGAPGGGAREQEELITDKAQLDRNRKGLCKTQGLRAAGGCKEVVCSHSLGEGKHVWGYRDR